MKCKEAVFRLFEVLNIACIVSQWDRRSVRVCVCVCVCVCLCAVVSDSDDGGEGQ